VRDADRDRYASVASLRRGPPLTIGVVADAPSVRETLQRHLPGVRMRFVVMPSPRDYATGKATGIDAFAMQAESAAAWSILYPSYAVVVPQPHPVSIPIGIGMRGADRDLIDYVDAWLAMQRASGNLSEARDYWVLGHGAEPAAPRWSVLRDVLGWQDRSPLGEAEPGGEVGPAIGGGTP
jgi:hypothetical protein